MAPATKMVRYSATTRTRRVLLRTERPDAAEAFVYFQALVTQMGHQSVVVRQRVGPRDLSIGSIDRHPGGGVTWTSAIGDLRRAEPPLDSGVDISAT